MISNEVIISNHILVCINHNDTCLSDNIGVHKELSSLRMKNSNRKYCGTDVPVSVIPGAMSQLAGGCSRRRIWTKRTHVYSC